MKSKTLIILLIILGLLAGTGLLLVRTKSPDRSKVTMEKHLLNNLPVNKISSITIKSSDVLVVLKKLAGQWVVANRFNYPADFSKIADFVRKLKEAKIGRHFASSEDILKRLSLKELDDPDALEQEKGTQLLLKDESENILASMLLGKARKPEGEDGYADGHYVKLIKDPEIYLIDTNFDYLEMKPSDWLEKLLLQVKENDVEKIICLDAEGKNQHYLLERPGRGKDMALTGLPRGRKLKHSGVNQLLNALSELRIDDITDPSNDTISMEKKFTSRIEYHLFNGMIYRIYPEKTCSEKNTCHLKLQVDYQKPESPEKETAEKQTAQKGGTENTPKALAIEAKKLNERFSPWMYVISEWRHKTLITDLDELLEKPDQGESAKK